MTWIKLDDNFYRHPKVRDLSNRAFRAWVSGIAYCSSLLTDGRIPRSAFGEIRATKRIENELKTAGLWHENGDGSIVTHDYLRYQTSRANAEKSLVAARDRVQKHRDLRSNVTPLHERFKSDDVTTLQERCSNADVTLPDPIPLDTDPRSEKEPPIGGKKDSPSAVAPPVLQSKKRIRGIQLPESWEPSADHCVLAGSLNLVMLDEASRFRDYCAANGKAYKDHDAAFRNWLRNASGFKRNGKAPGLEQHEKVRSEVASYSQPYHKVFADCDYPERKAKP